MKNEQERVETEDQLGGYFNGPKEKLLGHEQVIGGTTERKGEFSASNLA